MLSIGKLGRGAEGYYLNAVAKGVEDYYLGSGEALGHWVGAGSDLLGLAEVVDAEDLRAVLDGRRPSDRKSLLWVRREDRLPGFDLTFSAPKGVSLLFALGDPRTSLLVREAHDRAVAAALGYLEREAGEVRRGRDGIDRLPGGGFVAAAFRHRTSRAGDPQLHTHVLVANLTRGQDGRWSALDGRQLYWQAKTAGTLYQTALRHELRALGLRFTLRDNGLCELADVPREVLRAFSQRRVEIETELTRRGESSPAAAQVVTLATRKSKDYGVPAESLAAGWRARAEELGFDAAARERLLGATTPVPPSRDVLAQAAAVMLGPAGLTERSPVFDRRDALRAWCAQLPGGAPVAYVERLTDTLLERPDVIKVTRPEPDSVRPGAVRSFARHTNTDMLAVEAAVIDTALAARETGRALVTGDELEQVLATHPTLSGEQTAMVRRLCTSGDGVDVVVGKAGTGKTHALAAAHAAWTAAGHHVLGTAVAARAAIALTEEAGIPAMSIARLLATQDRAIARGLPGALPVSGVLVVDEAGMLGTRQLSRLLEAAGNAGAKLVLVGDDHQLPELSAGGSFRALAQALSASQLVENRRQVHLWERDALDDLRHGDAGRALDAYAEHGRITISENGEEQRETLVDAWWEAAKRDVNDRPTLPGPIMLATRRSDVDDLNRRARQRVADAGHVSGPVLGVDVIEHGRREFQVGDVVIARRNAYLQGLVNGQRGVITDIDLEGCSLTLETGTQRLDVPANYLRSGAIEHGYALTVHQAQGLTTDRTFLLGDSAMYREIGYVALSRARQRAELHLTSRPDQLTVGHEHSCAPPAELLPDPLVTARRSLDASHAQRTASELCR